MERAGQIAGVTAGAIRNYWRGIRTPSAAIVEALRLAAANVRGARQRQESPRPAQEPGRSGRPAGLTRGDPPAPAPAPAPTPAHQPAPEPAQGPQRPAFKLPLPDIYDPKAKPFSEAESGRMRPQLHDALGDFFTIADKGITATNRARAEAYIWRTIKDDDEEMRVLVSWLIEMGQAHPMAAQVARGIVIAWRRYQVGIILAPRFGDTVQHYIQHGGMRLW